MSEAMESLKSQVTALSSRDRAELAHFLIGTLDAESEDDVDAEWRAEVDRRLQGDRSGNSSGKPADQVFAELRARFP